MTIRHYSPLFATVRRYSHYSRLFATIRTIRNYSLFAIRDYSLFAIRDYSLFAIRDYSLFAIRDFQTPISLHILFSPDQRLPACRSGLRAFRSIIVSFKIIALKTVQIVFASLGQ